MIYAILTLFGILFFGGLSYYVLAEIYGDFYESMLTLYPTYFMTPEVDFIYNLIVWMPFFIVLIAVISAIVIELRSKNPDAYFQI